VLPQVLRRGFVLITDDVTGAIQHFDEEFTMLDWKEGQNLTLKAAPQKKVRRLLLLLLLLCCHFYFHCVGLNGQADPLHPCTTRGDGSQGGAAQHKISVAHTLPVAF
jgi:hypothetical protein